MKPVYKLVYNPQTLNTNISEFMRSRLSTSERGYSFLWWQYRDLNWCGTHPVGTVGEPPKDKPVPILDTSRHGILKYCIN